jgi:hypothetical protein
MDPTEAITFLRRTDYLLFRLGELLEESTDDPDILTPQQVETILTIADQLQTLETELNLFPVMPEPPPPE